MLMQCGLWGQMQNSRRGQSRCTVRHCNLSIHPPANQTLGQTRTRRSFHRRKKSHPHKSQKLRETIGLVQFNEVADVSS
jgi:hypothetical protein